ncbi:YadA-like family protein [Haemophilus haemolyticus]|uniref:YadA-like family protein n=1 Tax=Haemophilus haemolyticus TaxID=726 RepID=UPI001864E42C|nr:YadA-like family protein [Haemophilus haemolyticus]
MNKIFRIVWSQATQSWVAVSELTKAHKKQSSSNSQGSAVKFSGNFIKSSAVALALLSGHSAYAVVNEPGTGSDTNVAWGQSSNASGNNAVAVGRKAQATGDSAIAVGLDSKASGALAEAIGVAANATGDRSVAIGNQGKAEGTEAVAIGKGANASKASAVALGQGAQATGDRASAIGQNSKATQDDTIALGTNSKSTNTYTVALGRNTDAAGQRSMAFGNEAKATANDTIAFGSSSEAKQINDIIIGKEAKSRNEGGGHSIAIGYNSTAGSTKVGAATDVNSTGTNAAAGGVAIGVSSYTGLNKNNTAINSSVAIGAGAGAGYRAIGADGLPTGNGTDPDDNAKVLVKAFGGTTNTLDYFKNSGKANAEGFFSFQGVDINEGTALGRNTRAIGDQSVAIGAQSIAGQGSIVIGGNDIQAYDRKNYFKAANPESAAAKSVNDFDAETTPGTDKNGNKVTITNKYRELVGAALDNSYRASYGQDGSTVIGMQAHSTTPLGVAIGTNAIVRKGAFGATAIGSGASILANAEAAVAIGMGAEAQGNYAVAAGTAARAKESAVAAGYQANANVSAVAIGDHSNATTSSVAVGQLAQATKEADIAVGQGAKASGNQGAIAMGLGTNAQGDSSIMIGGADIKSASAQTIKYQKATGGTTSRDVTEKINGKDVTRHYSFSETKEVSGKIADAYKELTGLVMETDSINFADAKNKNGHASTSLGVHALSRGDLGTAIGASSRADAIGSVALGVGAKATKQNAVAIGTGSTTDLVGTRQLSVNYDSDGNIVSDNSDKIAYTFKWAGGTNTSEGDVVSFGSSGAERQLKNVAAGRVAEDSTDAINGSQLNSITKKIAAGFNTSGNKVTDSSGVFTSKKANNDPAEKDYETAIRSDDKVQFQVGNNLKLDRNETEVEVDAPDDFDKTKTVKKKIRKADFAYSLNPVLTNLTSAEFIGTGTDAPTTKLTNDGVTITPKTAGKKPVSLTQNGLDNGGNPITDVAGNLDGAKANTNAPTTNSTKPATLNNSNAATVGDVLNAGWNLQEKGTAKDFVTAYDTVNFVDGDGTTVSVENTDGKTSTIKYSANLGDGLEKDATTNKIKVKAADKSLEVTNEGVKVKAADNTLTTDDKGLKVNTGTINPVDSGDKAGTVAVNTNDAGKIATVDTVVNAVNNAAWNAIASKTNDGENGGTVKKQAVKAGDTVTFEADKNIKIAQDGSKFTFSTKDNVEFKSVKVGEDKDGKKPVNLTTDKATNVSNNDPANKPTTALNVSSDGKPTQITGVGSVLNTEAVPTIPAGTATNAAQQPKLVNLGTAHGQTALDNNVLNAAATVRDLASMGWVVSSDKTTDATGEYKDVVKNANEVKFVGKNAAKVSGKTDPKTGIRTITVDVEVPSVETAKITQNTDGSVTGPAGETLTKALKDAKDALAKLPKGADPAAVQAAQAKVDEAQKAIDNSPNSNKVATAQNVADMINNSGFTLKTSNVEGGEKDATSTGDEVINPGKAVEMIAGKNLTVKQEANGKVTYSTKDEVEFTSVKVGDTKNGKAPVNFTTEAAKPANNNGTDKTPTTALNVSSSDGKPTQLKGVGSVLNTKAQPTSTGKQGDTPATAGNQNLVNLTTNEDGSPLANEILNSAATVGDLANMGWVVSTKDGNDYKDVVKNANQVDFVGKNGITVTGKTGTDGVRTITVEAAQTPVVYTNKAGDKLVKVGDKFYKADEVENGKPKENAQVVPNGDVIASMNNGGNNTANKPMQLANIGSNLPTVNDTNKQAFDPNSTTPKADKNNKSAPMTAAQAAELLNPKSDKFAGNNAATVSDVLNAGWNLQGNGQAVDFVKPFDTVNFVNGKGTKAVVETADNLTSTVKFDVDAGEITSNTNGSVTAPVTADEAKKLADDLANAQNAVNNLAPNADDAAKKKAQDALKAAQDAAAPLNKVATAQNVAEMINNSGFTLKADKTEGDNLTEADLAKGEMINPGDTITMKAGKNMSVKHEKDGSITYATKDEVEFNTVKVGGDANTYVDDKGNPVTKQGDSFVDAQGNKVDAAKVSPVAPVTLKTEKASPANNNAEGNHPTTALNISSGTGTDAKPTQLKGVGSVLDTQPQQTSTGKQGDIPATAGNQNLVNLGNDPKAGNKSSLAPEILNSAATVGDLANMGWVVSTKDGNDYKDVVKNANQVDFKGTGLATVTGETDKDGIRTITVNVDAQKTFEAAQTPVVYTNKAGDKLVKVGDKFYKADEVENGKPKENAQEVPKGDVIASMNNGDNNTSKPMQLANIGSNLPTVNDTNKQAFDPNSTEPKDKKDNKSAPITAAEAAELLNPTTADGKANPKFAGNNAATVSDVLNAGWNLQNNGEARDFVKPYDTVNFVNGIGTVAVVETDDKASTSNVTFNVDMAEITPESDGSVKGPVPQKLLDALDKAQEEVEKNPNDEAAKKALEAAEDAVNKAGGNKVANAQNVADMINASGFTLKTSATADGKKESGDDEIINPGKTVEMIAGKNLTVKQEANGKVTYATKDDVSFNTVNVGDNSYVDADGKPVTKNADGTYTDSKGQPIEEGKVTKLAPVAMKAEKAKPATNNGNKAEDQPTTALNVSSSDGKPTQITGVGSTLNVKPVDTNPNGTATTGDARPNLVDLVGTDTAPVNKNAAATVGDLQNMGWVVSTKDGNGYKDVVKNANQVDFKGGTGISVKGETTKDGVREITISVKDGEVIKPNQFTAKVNGTDTPVTKVGDQYYNTADIDPKTGNPKANVTPVTPDKGTTPTNAGDGYVTGNKVATAIQKSGFVVGKQKDALSAADFKDEDEKVNPDDELRFADGNNTKVKLATKESVDKDGNKVTTTTVKVDVTGLPVQYTDKNGTPVTKVGDKYFTVDDKGNPTATEVKPEDLTTNMVNPAAAPNKIGAPTALGNVKSNLPSVNDADKNAKDVAGNPIAGKDNKSASITAKEAADIINKAGNNAATVSDVLNAGWNLQNNGEARDFVKPYDTVNFVNGKGTKAVVETADNLTSTVKFDVDAGEITADTTKPGAVKGPVTADEAKKLADDLKKAEQAVKDLPADATEDKKAEAQKALKDAQAAAAPLNKVATAQNVADMINASGFTLKTSATADGKKESGDDEVINPGKTVEMIAGKNLTVKQEANGKVTYATKDDVSFNTVNVGDNSYVDADGKPVTKNADGTYTDSKGQPIEEGKVTKLAPVAMKAEKAKPATNNGNKAEDQPTTALNVSSSDGKPTQITGVGSTLNVKPVDTNPNGTATTGDARPNLVDLVGTDTAPVNKNAAATVGDLQNMGWVVSTKDGNGYKDVVKNANQVDFKGGTGISVKGETTKDGVREITISVKDGEVIKPNQFTAKVNGTDTPVTKVGDQYYNTADIDPKTGNPKANVTPVTPDKGTTPTNAGDGYVTGNKVATAIQKSGFVVGKQKDALSAADFKDEDEKVNPDDELRFADGNNTKVKLATKESVDKDGNKVTTTTVKVDVTGLPVQYTDKNGTPVTKVGDKYFTVDDKGNPTATEVKPEDLTTNMVNPAAAPNKIGAPTALGNVKSNLPSVNDADKNAKDVAGNPIAGKDNKSAPITATEAADLLNPKTADGKANPKFAGNNAATVSDVLNTGWNLQNNGEAKDFVKPYDTVNFVDGKGTKAVVETTPNGTTSNVKFDIDTGSITNNADGSVQGPVVTPEMTKALEDATNALNSLPPTAPAAVIDAAKKAVADAANNIANVANKVATAQDVANAINKSGFALTTSANGGEKISGTPEMINPGKKVEMVAGKNMTVKQESNGKVTYATASNVTFDSVQFGDKGPKITNKAGNINVSGPDGKTPTKITGVAPGEISATSKDAINGSQLHAVASNLNNKINKVGKHADAGTASALAAANIPQAYTPGKSLVGIAAGNYQGQNGLAVGMSRISDNGKIIIRLSGTANSQGKTGVAAGVGYQW